MAPKIETPTPATDPDYVGEVIGYTDDYINHRTRAQMEILFRKVGGVYCYDVGYLHFDARAQFITILNDARENIAAGVFTDNQRSSSQQYMIEVVCASAGAHHNNGWGET